MKKVVSIVLMIALTAGMLYAFTACARKNEQPSGGNDQTDVVIDAGDDFAADDFTADGSDFVSAGEKLVCGVTQYEPMNYLDENGNWTGFDTEFALLVGERLGMEVEFQEIEWASKYFELASGAINCIWNGFTANASESDGTSRSDLVDMSYSYMLNQQCVVIKADRADEFTSIEDLAHMNVAAEVGSAGESVAKDVIDHESHYFGASSQIASFMDVKAGAVDCTIVDILLAQKRAGEGDYSDLMIAGIELDSEVYAIGFKQGSDLTAKVNAAMIELYNEGALTVLAEKYGLENVLYLDFEDSWK